MRGIGLIGMSCQIIHEFIISNLRGQQSSKLVILPNHNNEESFILVWYSVSDEASRMNESRILW